MKYLHFCLFILCAFSCHENNNQKRIAADNEKNKEKNNGEKTTKSVEQNNIIIPDGLYLDTLISFDSSLNLKMAIVLPTSKNNRLSLSDRMLRKEVEEHKNSFIKKIKKIQKDINIKHFDKSTLNNQFELFPCSVFIDDNTLSYLFYIDGYVAGAPHSITTYYSFNFDLKKQKRILFSDYFISSNTFKKKIQDDIKTYFNNSFFRVSDFYDHNFNFSKDSIFFNFGNYEIGSYGEGTPSARFSKKKFINDISKEYR